MGNAWPRLWGRRRQWEDCLLTKQASERLVCGWLESVLFPLLNTVIFELQTDSRSLVFVLVQATTLFLRVCGRASFVFLCILHVCRR